MVVVNCGTLLVDRCIFVVPSPNGMKTTVRNTIIVRKYVFFLSIKLLITYCAHLEDSFGEYAFC